MSAAPKYRRFSDHSGRIVDEHGATFAICATPAIADAVLKAINAPAPAQDASLLEALKIGRQYAKFAAMENGTRGSMADLAKIDAAIAKAESRS